MSDTRGLRLKPPTSLPQGPVSKVAFKVFINQLRAYLEQDQNNYLFLPEGCYSTWQPRREGRRILELATEDADNQKLIRQADNDRGGTIDLEEEQNRLLLSRNSQLSKFITLIAIACYYTEQDDINDCSTSWEWILTYLKQHYNIESRGEHFLDIATLTYSSDLPYQTYYKQFRASFLDNLRKRGDRLAYKNNLQLTEDENMNPTLEATIVLWSLERIDPRLPSKVKKNYGHQMVGDQCLVSLQPTIFQNIGNMLAELYVTDNSLAARFDAQTNICNMVTPRKQDRAPGKSYRGRSAINNRPSYRRQQTGLKKNFCRLCYHAGANPAAYTSHPISACTYLTRADKNDLKNLNAMQTLTLDETPQGRPIAYNAPGWDTDESEFESNDPDEENDEANDNNYIASMISVAGAQSNTLIPQLNVIQPVPSQVLLTQFKGMDLPITLDSGATISFIRLKVAQDLKIPIKPNKQIATLADEQSIIRSLGEIDITVTHNQHPIRLRALVVDRLQASCFGGTSFHLDNEIVPDICREIISIKGNNFFQHNISGRHASQQLGRSEDNRDKGPLQKCAQLKLAQVTVPCGELLIPVPKSLAREVVFVTPSFPGVDPNCWPAQLCWIQN